MDPTLPNPASPTPASKRSTPVNRVEQMTLADFLRQMAAPRPFPGAAVACALAGACAAALGEKAIAATHRHVQVPPEQAHLEQMAAVLSQLRRHLLSIADQDRIPLAPGTSARKEAVTLLQQLQHDLTRIGQELTSIQRGWSNLTADPTLPPCWLEQLEPDVESALLLVHAASAGVARILAIAP
ncbi:MAG: cyclodeaminase/cyclohydrolase family protein [Limnochordaceae bacterium]|nr:cyclodeaminase/cyclohydrolase family protein [Limnochordaceae bacterium]